RPRQGNEPHHAPRKPNTPAFGLQLRLPHPHTLPMFSGIVAACGRIEHIAPLEDGVRLTVDVGGLDLSDVAIGDSIANSGVCLTVVAIDGNRVNFDVSRETLNCTVGLDTVGNE